MQDTLMMKYDEYFPLKTIKLCEDPWVTNRIKQLDRLRRREFYKNKKSVKWLRLNSIFLETCEKEKKKYAEKIVSDLRASNPSKWYSKIKRMSGQNKAEDKSMSQNWTKYMISCKLK